MTQIPVRHALDFIEDRGGARDELLSVTTHFGLVPSSPRVRDRASSDLSRYLRVKPGDVVVNRLIAQFGAIAFARTEGIVSPAYWVLRPVHNSLHAPYIGYLMRSRPFVDQVARLSKFAPPAQFDIRWDRFRGISLEIPSLAQQRNIARYLDHAELRIARAIAAKQELLILLTQRQKQIAQSVVFGVATTATKPSNEKWLGDVPAHWELRRLKSYFTEVAGKGRADLPLLAATQSHGVVTKAQYGRRTVTAQQGLENLKVVREGDFVISLRSFEGGIELAHAEGIISPAYTVIRPLDHAITPYFAGVFKTPAFIDAIRMSVTGIREGQNVNYQKLSRVLVPLPTADERGRMVVELNARLASGIAAIRAVQDEVELLKEYRVKLISDVVTGKLDVSKEAAGLPDIDPEELAHVLSGTSSGTMDDEEGDGDGDD